MRPISRRHGDHPHVPSVSSVSSMLVFFLLLTPHYGAPTTLQLRRKRAASSRYAPVIRDQPFQRHRLNENLNFLPVLISDTERCAPSISYVRPKVRVDRSSVTYTTTFTWLLSIWERLIRRFGCSWIPAQRTRGSRRMNVEVAVAFRRTASIRAYRPLSNESDEIDSNSSTV